MGFDGINCSIYVNQLCFQFPTLSIFLSCTINFYNVNSSQTFIAQNGKSTAYLVENINVDSASDSNMLEFVRYINIVIIIIMVIIIINVCT